MQLCCEITRWLAWVVGWLPFKLVWPSLNGRCGTKICCPVVIESKSVTTAFDHLVGGDYAFGNQTILFDFWFNEGAIIELPGPLLIWGLRPVWGMRPPSKIKRWLSPSSWAKKSVFRKVRFNLWGSVLVRKPHRRSFDPLAFFRGASFFIGGLLSLLHL
jgi:hypothetical protein